MWPKNGRLKIYFHTSIAIKENDILTLISSQLNSSKEGIRFKFAKHTNINTNKNFVGRSEYVRDV